MLFIFLFDFNIICNQSLCIVVVDGLVFCFLSESKFIPRLDKLEVHYCPYIISKDIISLINEYLKYKFKNI